MGSCYNEVVLECGSGLKDLTVAFENLVKRAAWEHGHGGYTGSFAEKTDGVTVIPAANDYWDRADAEEHATEHAPKWGPAHAYYLRDGKWYIGAWCSS